AAVRVLLRFRLAAVQALVAAPSPVMVTAALADAAAVPICAETLREPGLTVSARGTGAAVITSVSMIRSGEPVAPLAVTVIVSTYVPTARPLVLRVHATVPLPVPPAVVSVVQLF